jgi:CheY-like chemotaxis protein
VSQPDVLPANVHRLHRVRVLLIGSDRRFLRVTGALLASEGHIVESSERASELLELVHRHETDVAVIDASTSLANAALAAASLRALPEPVATVLVTDRDRTSLPGLSVVYKWGGFDDLCRRVDEAYLWRCRACA